MRDVFGVPSPICRCWLVLSWSASIEEVFAVDRDSLVMSVEDAAFLLGISRGLAYSLVREGSIPSLRLGKRWVVPRGRLLGLVEGDGSSGAAVGAVDPDRVGDARE